MKEIESPRQELTFNQLKIYYEECGLKLNDNFLQNLDLLTSEGKYNYNAFLLADENNISIKLVKYVGNNKLELLENMEYGNRCLSTATQKLLDRLDVENTTYAKIEYFGNKELIRVFKDVELIENIGSGVLRILDAYDKSCFKFMEHFLRVSFKYKENPFEYEVTAKEKSSKLAVSEEEILKLCKTVKSLKEITQYFGYKDVYKFKNNYINKLIEQDKLQMTIPDKPKSRNQKYISKNR